jgi:hypothetical protein
VRKSEGVGRRWGGDARGGEGTGGRDGESLEGVQTSDVRVTVPVMDVSWPMQLVRSSRTCIARRGVTDEVWKELVHRAGVRQDVWVRQEI